MQKKDFIGFFKKKGTVAVMSLCLIGAVAFATFYTMNANQNAKEKEKLIDLSQETESIDDYAITEEPTEEVQDQIDTNDGAENNISNSDAYVKASEASKAASAGVQSTDQGSSEDANAESASNTGMANSQTEAASPSVDANSNNVAANIEPTVDFKEGDTLTWPVAGSVLVNYSMDATVYFKTLNQYKYNPAVIIGCESGSQVLSAAKGIVESIGKTDETGTTVTLKLGNNFELVYGQLTDLAVKVGDVVDPGALIGKIAEPSKYYCLEGSNLFFEMKKDGLPVDPFLYLE